MDSCWTRHNTKIIMDTIILDVELQLHWHRTDTVGNGGFIYKITYVSKLWTYTVEINSIKFVCR
jgi:hypothetical protein